MTPVAPISERLDGISWAFFFIWIGIALLADIGWAWALTGVAVIILSTQAASFIKTGRVHGFWVACGAALLAISAWILLDLKWPLSPLLLILLGGAILVKTLFDAYRRQ
jgi:hypothetical protein